MRRTDFVWSRVLREKLRVVDLIVRRELRAATRRRLGHEQQHEHQHEELHRVHQRSRGG